MSSLRLSNNELKHWKYVRRENVGGKWRYWYDDAYKNDDHPIGQNYKTQTEVMAEREYQNSVNELKSAEQESKSADMRTIEKTLKKADRYVEAAKVWLSDKLHTSIADTLKKKTKPLSWEQAKEYVDSTYVYGDEDLFLTDRYRKKKSY